jgi:hypothetical protein
MNGSDATQAIDRIDLLCAAGIFSCFVAFAVVMWFLKREMNKKKIAVQKDTGNSHTA